MTWAAKGYIFDIDGTLALAGPGGQGYEALPGAADVVSRLNAQAIPIIAYTNGTFHTPEVYRASLAAVGMDFKPGHVFTPASVAADYFVKRRIDRVQVLGTEGVIRPLIEAGIEVITPKDSFEYVPAVLVGWYPDFTMPDLESACRAIWAGAALFTTSKAPYFAGRGGRIIGISGAISAMLKSVTGKNIALIGKPSVIGIQMACERMRLRPADIAVVGDDPRLEIKMARRAGAHAIGVTTGIASRGDFMALPDDQKAHTVLASVGDLHG